MAILANPQLRLFAGAILISFSPVFVNLVEVSPTTIGFYRVPLAIGGLTLIVGPDWSALTPNYRLGVAFGVLTAASYAGYLLCMRVARLESPHAVPMREVAVMSLFVAVFMGAAALAEGESLAIPGRGDLIWLMCYGLLCHALGLMFIASSLSKVSTTEVGIALLLQPSLSYLWDILFFDRPVSVTESLGAMITLFAIFLGSGLRSKQAQSAS